MQFRLFLYANATIYLGRKYDKFYADNVKKNKIPSVKESVIKAGNLVRIKPILATNIKIGK